MAKPVDTRMKRWMGQRWLLDAVIRTVGLEWDQARLAYMAAPGGPEAAGDFRGVGARVKNVADIDREFAAAARRREAKARAFEEQERFVAARESYLIAALLWASARWPIFEITDKLLEFDRKTNECYEKFIQYAHRPIEKVDIDFEGKKMPGYLHLPRAPADGETFPCVINWPGMDSCKENGVMMYGDHLLNRDIAVLSIDGPGQGESCSIPILVTATNHMDAGIAAADWLAAHPAIDADRLAIKGTSFGTFFGTQAAAALGDRIKGCAVTGVCHEPGCNTIFNMASPSFKLRFMFMAGYEDEDAFDEFAETLDLRPIAGDIKAPWMAIAGADDQLSPVEHTEELFDLVKAPKRMVIYEGANHGLNEGASVQLGENRATMIADWLKDRLDGKPAVSERVFIDSTGRATVTQL